MRKIKHLSFLLIFVFFLVSCTSNKKEIITTETNQKQKVVSINNKVKQEDIKQEKLSEISEEGRKEFDELSINQKSGDIKKENETREKIKKLVESKETELSEAIKNWDNEKVKTLKNELKIIKIMTLKSLSK